MGREQEIRGVDEEEKNRREEEWQRRQQRGGGQEWRSGDEGRENNGMMA